MVARTDTAEPNRAVIEAAAFWQAQLADEECDDASRIAFDRWLQADRSHKVAFDRMNAIAGKVSGQSPVERTALGMMLERGRGRRATLPLILALTLGSTAVLTSLGADQPAIRSQFADERTPVGEQHRTALPSGDRLVFDSASAADVDEEERVIRLWRGGVMARVAKGDARAFVVQTPQGTARALGTQFSVRVENDVTTVTVIESRVETCANTGKPACLVQSAGQSARIDGRGVSRIADVDPASESAWGDGLLVADDRPLSEIIDTLNRYRRDPLRYSHSDLHGLRVSGTFPLTDTDRALASLRAALPIVIARDDQGTSIRRR